MNIEPKNTPIYKYRLYDFARPEGEEIIGGIHHLTKNEAIVFNRAFRMNHTQKNILKKGKFFA